MRLMNKVWLLGGILSLILLQVSCAFSSSENKRTMLQEANAMLGQEIDFGNDSVIYESTLKIITLVADTGDCTTCSMQVYDWYLYKLDLNNKSLKCDIVYILHDSVRLNSEVQKLLGYYNLYYTTNLKCFVDRNKGIATSTFNTFLVGKDNRIKLVGSPLNNERLWSLYKEVIKKESR